MIGHFAWYARSLGRQAVVPAIVLILLQAACAPAVRLKAPEQWPASWCDRQLYHTPSAYIYATSGAAAGEADRLILSVAAEFKDATGAKPTKGVILVTDERDALPPIDWDKLIRLIQQTKNPSSQPVGDGRVDLPTESLGIGKEVFYKMLAFGLTREEAAGLMKLPEPLRSEARWITIMPTRATLAGATRQMMRAAFKKNNIGFAAQALAAPLLAVMEPKMVDMMGVTRDIAMYSALTGDQPQWTPDEQRERRTAYEQRKTKSAADAFAASIPKAQTRPAGPPATRPVETQPAGPPATQPVQTQPGGPPATRPAQTRPAAASQPCTAPEE